MTEKTDGQQPLANAKREAFARAIVAGASQREAYLAAGYKPRTDAAADTAASRLLSEVEVARRVNALKAAAADKTVMDLKEVLQELSKLGRSSIQDMVNVGGDDSGDVIQSLRDMKPEHAAAVQELTIETYLDAGAEPDEMQEPQGHGGSLRRRRGREVKKVKIKLHDKRAALSELRRHLEPVKHADPDGRPLGTGAAEAAAERDQLSELELARRIAFALESAARRKPAKATDTLAGGATAHPRLREDAQTKAPQAPKPKEGKTP